MVMLGDPIGDFIIRLKNASAVGKESVTLPHSKIKMSVAETLSKEGFVGAVEKSGKKVRKTIQVSLLYKDNGSPRILDVKRLSKPSRRVYKGVDEIHPVRYGKGLLVLSTPKGVMSGRDARKEGVGGEALFEIY